MNLKDLFPALQQGGFSYSTEFGSLSGAKAYAISIPGYEKIYESITEEDIKEYFQQHSEFVALMPERFIGGWQHDGKYFLDVCDYWHKDEYTLEGAVEIGRLRDQISIFDLETGDTHYCCDGIGWIENDIDTIWIEPVVSSFKEFMKREYSASRLNRYPFYHSLMKWGNESGLKQFYSEGRFYIITREVRRLQPWELSAQ